MQIGIAVFSRTGNTLSVVDTLQGKLEAAGHGVTLERVSVVGEYDPQRALEFELDLPPTLDQYEGLVIAAPVQAFSLHPVMNAYLKQEGSLAGKQVACLAPQQFPYPWLGGNRAVRQMTKLL